MKWLLFFFLLITNSFLGSSQFIHTTHLSTENGLSTNKTYTSVQDKNNLWWIATDNGVLRYDGKSFDYYGIDQGLSDNDIPNLVYTEDGTIWAFPFGGWPCYFDHQTNRFKSDYASKIILTKMINAQPKSIYKNQIITFNNSYSSFIMNKDSKTIRISQIERNRIGEIIISKNKNKSIYINSLNLSDQKFQMTYPIQQHNETIFNYDDHNIYFYKIINDTIEMTDSLFIVDQINNVKYNNHRVVAVTKSNKALILDPLSHKIMDTFSSKKPIRTIVIDKFGKIWIHTVADGLYIKHSSPIHHVYNLKQPIFQCAKKDNKLIYCGGSGNIYEHENGESRLLKSNSVFIKQLLLNNGNIIVINSDYTSSIIKRNSQVVKFQNSIMPSKNACIINDSIILTGNHAKSMLVNTENSQIIDTIHTRMISCAKRGTHRFIGNTQGVFDWQNNKLSKLDIPILNGKKINSLYSTDDLLFIGTPSKKIYVINKENKCIDSLQLNKYCSGHICNFIVGKGHIIWLATDQSLCKIKFAYPKFKLLEFYEINKSNGLIGNEINDLEINGDSILVATEKVVSFFPLDLHLPPEKIKPLITSVSINSEEQFIKGRYNLSNNHYNILIKYAAIYSNGYPASIQYKLNDQDWFTADDISLHNLGSGDYRLQIRVLNMINQSEQPIHTIDIHIATIFYKRTSFWILFIMLMGLLFFIWYKKKQELERLKLKKQNQVNFLELKALRAQMNPHFVFNCLNSIKSLLIQDKLDDAETYLDLFASILRNTTEAATETNIQNEIAYLDNYLALEKLRFREKLKYQLIVDENCDLNQKIPTMLIQPFVENAIKHGIHPLTQKQGLITIVFDSENKITIDDNGVGREYAQHKTLDHKSMGLNITMQRASILKININIEDKKNNQGQPLGTKVTIFLNPYVTNSKNI